MIHARFQITTITKHAGGSEPGGEVKLQPDVHADNKEWARYTPAGQLAMHVNGPAFAWFEEHLGATIALTFDALTEEG